MVGLRKDRIKSIILCKNREFKSKAVILLTGAAFPAEKITVESIDEAISKINQDSNFQNLVIDSSMYRSKEELSNVLKSFAEANNKKQARALCLLDELHMSDLGELQSISPLIEVDEFPLAQSQFNRAFNSKASKALSGQPLVPDFPQAKNDTETNNSNPKASGSLSILETSQHIKDTINMINQVAKDRSNVNELLNIGQRFNGLIGAFQFFNNKPGYPELKGLAEIIDTIGKTYREESWQTIDNDHWQLVVAAAKCSYLIVKDLREERIINDQHLATYSDLQLEFGAMKDLHHKHNFSQDEVDQLIASGK